MFSAFLAAVFFALSAVFAHRTTRLLGAMNANLARIWVAAALLCSLACAQGNPLRGVALETFFVSGIVGFGLGDLALFAAYPRLGSRLTILLMQCLSAPFAAAIEWLWLGTQPGLPELLCGATILAGVGLAVAPAAPTSMIQITPGKLHPHRTAGIIYGVLAALGQAGGVVISRKAFALTHAAGQDVDGFTAAFQRALGGVLVITIAFLLARQLTQPRVTEPAADWRVARPWVLANAVVGPTLGVGFLQRALIAAPSAVVLPMVALTPLLVVPLAFFLEGERPTHRSLAGGAIAVVAAAALAVLRAT